MEFQITETVFIAMLTASVSLVGAVAGIITALITSRISASVRLQELSVQASLAARIEKYGLFLDACIEFEKDFDNLEKKATMISALNMASVVAEEKTAKLMVVYQSQLLNLNFKSEKTQYAKHELLTAMQSDIHTITMPKIVSRR